ncbi:nuclear transport factor 2 family protein [Sphingomonas canadensis]|uniref:Nuclear transport factor 2 family protein n=1 Tax=Sphingomonas canadensis TaxID=1219257 RepID=A0ABW3HAV0_9SPHN|nr:nuclear transport factor 2 family protein [Sphingomonas canadensis]MCW3838326.1 nuclear transport factor 2 family protein [Sphingomonas canadensis]
MAIGRAAVLALVAAALTSPAAGHAGAGRAVAVAPVGKKLTGAEIAAIRQECETLAARYSLYLDGKDWQNLPSVFAEDGVWDILSNHLAGRDAIRDYWKSRTADWAPTHGRLHQVTNQVIDVIDRDHARGTSMVIVYFFDTAPGANKALTPLLIARNHDEFVRTAEGWKIKHRRVERIADVAH